MKKLAAALAIATALINTGHIYPQTVIITDTADNLVTVQTSQGISYQFEGAEDYEAGDLVSVIMFDNGTQDIRDDIILSHRYAGNF